jgi:type VI secretion system protein VasD
LRRRKFGKRRYRCNGFLFQTGAAMSCLSSMPVRVSAALCAGALAACSSLPLADALLQASGLQKAAPISHNTLLAPRQVTLRLHASAGLNRGPDGQPLSLLTRVYLLRQTAAFERMPFDSVLNAQTERDILGADLLDVREVLLLPGQRYETREQVRREAAFIGVVAMFRAPAPARWRAAFAVEQAEHAGITLGLHGCAMTAGGGAAPLHHNLADLAELQCH